MALVASARPAMSGMGGMRRVDFSLHSALTAWQNGPFALLVLAGVIMAAYWYLRADWMLSARGRRWPWTRTLAFLAGLVAVDLALQSPVATFTGTYFQAHVLQHLLLMVVAPPLLALGAPSTLLLQTARRRTKERWLGILRSPAFAVLTHPITVWCLYFGIMFAFFLSSLINVAMHHMALMDLLNLLFLFGGTLYWWPMVGLDPIVHWKMGHGARMVNILLGGPPEVILGLAILSLRVPIASMYTLSSTHAGGALLWISTEFVVIAAFMPIFWQWMRSDERAAARLDAQAAQPAPAQQTASRAPSAQPAASETAPAPVPRRSFAPAPARVAAPGGLTLWEAAWLARTGRIPTASANWQPADPPAQKDDD
jgi:putative membrane protein